MSYFNQRDYQPPSMLDALFGWLFGMIAISILLGIVIELVAPLLPWIGVLFVVAIGIRLWLRRQQHWY